MDILFYDRKNKRTVRASQLMSITLHETTLTIDSEEFTKGKWKGHETHPAYLKDTRIGNIGYKSENCSDSRNWDLWLTDSDLVFLETIREV